MSWWVYMVCPIRKKIFFFLLSQKETRSDEELCVRKLCIILIEESLSYRLWPTQIWQSLMLTHDTRVRQMMPTSCVCRSWVWKGKMVISTVMYYLEIQGMWFIGADLTLTWLLKQTWLVLVLHIEKEVLSNTGSMNKKPLLQYIFIPWGSLWSADLILVISIDFSYWYWYWLLRFPMIDWILLILILNCLLEYCILPE